MKMKKARFEIKPNESGDAYRLQFNPNSPEAYEMTFNDWLAFLDKILHKKKHCDDFDLYRLFTGFAGYLMQYENGFVIETSEPHALHIFAPSVPLAIWRSYLERYITQYGAQCYINTSGVIFVKQQKRFSNPQTAENLLR